MATKKPNPFAKMADKKDGEKAPKSAPGKGKMPVFKKGVAPVFKKGGMAKC
jgi:hypothetical protein